MNCWKWVLIIAEVLKLIASGILESEAVEKVAELFGVGAEEIWKHVNF